MSQRRRAREMALQALFYLDKSPLDQDQALELYGRNFPPSKDIANFFHLLSQGVVEHRELIDGLLEKHSAHWKLYRMSAVDRNAMRIAVFEFLYCDDIPETVSINEAIELAKKYGTDESGAFVNGILDNIRRELSKA